MNQAKPPATTSQESSATEEQVSAFLQKNPLFLSQRPDLLETLTIPHQNGGSISLIERQISVLRDKNAQLESQQKALNVIALQNDKTQARLHRLLVEVLTAKEINSALALLTEALASGFELEHVTVRLFADTQHPLQHIDPAYVITSESSTSTLQEFTESPDAAPICSHLSPSQIQRLFGTQVWGIKSNVIIPLQKGKLQGLIAMGTVDATRFSPDMDTLYLKRLGELISIALIRLLDAG